MTKYIVKRIGLAFVALFLILFIVFVLLTTFGVDPSNSVDLNLKNADEIRIAHRKLFGLNENVITRFFKYIFNLIQGNFGTTLRADSTIGLTGPSILEYFFNSAKFTLAITFPSVIISTIFGTILGVIAGYKRGTLIDSSINVFALFFIALPSFVLAPILINILVQNDLNPLFPTDSTNIKAILISIISPIILISFTSLATYVNFMRNQTIFVLNSNHVLIAKAKGLSTFKIFYKHVLRNISIPLFSIVVPSFVLVLSGSVILESIFSIPGSSKIAVNALKDGEVNILCFTTLFFTSLTLLSQIIVDVAIGFLDPKIKIAEALKRNIFKVYKNKFNYHWITYKKNKNVLKNSRRGDSNAK